MVLIASQWMNALNARSEYVSVFRRIATLNKGLGIGFVIAFALQMLVIFGPLASSFHVQPVAISTLLFWSLTAMAVVLFVGELHKLAIRRGYIRS